MNLLQNANKNYSINVKRFFSNVVFDSFLPLLQQAYRELIDFLVKYHVIFNLNKYIFYFLIKL